ncbi:MAG: hypothetical protein WD181_01495 [Solirubrobacterales bacterium]
MKKISVKTADALDLMIEFATLGEYGLEYPDEGSFPSGDPCEEVRRRAAPDHAPRSRAKARNDRSTVTQRRPVVRTVARSFGDTTIRKGNLEPSTGCQLGNPAFASALRPPRIKFSSTE